MGLGTFHLDKTLLVISLILMQAWGHRGEISLASISVPTAVLLADPVNISLSWLSAKGELATGNRHENLGSVRVPCGEIGQVRVSVRNCSAIQASFQLRVQSFQVRRALRPWSPAYLRGEVLQSTDAGQPKVSLSNKLLWVGSLQVAFAKVRSYSLVLLNHAHND